MHLPYWRSIVGGVLLAAATCGQQAAAQEPGFSAADLPVVMTAYVEAVIDMRAAYEACAPADKRPGEWEKGADLLMQSVKAAGLDTVVAATLEARLAAPVVPLKLDCASEQATLYSGVPAGDGWPAYHRAVLGLNGIKVVEPGVEDIRLEAVRAVVAEALPKQKRMLVCISLFDAQNFLAAFSEWNGLVAQVAQAFVAAGFGADAYGPMLDGALSRMLYAPPPDRDEAAADCMADKEWLDRFSTFAWYSFASDVETALKAGQP